MSADERTLFIVNPRSAGGKTKRNWPEIEKIARDKLGGLVSTRMTEGPGHATELTTTGIKEGYDLIVSVGGDGTNNEVLNGFFADDHGTLVDPNVAFGFLPAGTGCDLAKTFEISPKDPRAGLARLASGEISVDVGCCSYTSHTGEQESRYFLNVAGFGANGDVVARVNKSGKKLGGFGTFAVATIASLLSYDNQRVTYSVDNGDEVTERINTMFVCNARFVGGGMIVGPEARMDDGVFDLTLIGDISRMNAFGNGRLLYSGRIYEHPQSQHIRAKVLKARPLDRDPVLIDLDGEQPGRLPATFQIHPSVLRMRT